VLGALGFIPSCNGFAALGQRRMMRCPQLFARKNEVDVTSLGRRALGRRATGCSPGSATFSVRILSEEAKPFARVPAAGSTGKMGGCSFVDEDGVERSVCWKGGAIETAFGDDERRSSLFFRWIKTPEGRKLIVFGDRGNGGGGDSEHCLSDRHPLESKAGIPRGCR
jgi:hypothetical protein